MQDSPNVILVIPSLEPDEKLLKYIKELIAAQITNIIVVNDGSSSQYDVIFDEVSALGCKVLTHEVNKGKGVALKTAYQYISDIQGGSSIIITADSDGQHTVEDVKKVIDATEQHSNALVLGSRNFDLPIVPFKSRFGNKLTSRVFKLFYGKYVQDTQTGLRGFHSSYLGDMLAVEGKRFEYEMNVLIYFAKHKLPFEMVEIQTIYDNNNAGTHFHPIKDSIKVYKVIFPRVFKFLSLSLATTLMDYILFVILFHLQLVMQVPESLSIFIAGYTARFVSSLCNFYMNKNFVFKNAQQSTKIAMLKYAILALTIISASNLLTNAIHKSAVLNATIAKPIVDTLLFIVSYNVQRLWVFKK